MEGRQGKLEKYLQPSLYYTITGAVLIIAPRSSVAVINHVFASAGKDGAVIESGAMVATDFCQVLSERGPLSVV